MFISLNIQPQRHHLSEKKPKPNERKKEGGEFRGLFRKLRLLFTCVLLVLFNVFNVKEEVENLHVWQNVYLLREKGRHEFIHKYKWNK